MKINFPLIEKLIGKSLYFSRYLGISPSKIGIPTWNKLKIQDLGNRESLIVKRGKKQKILLATSIGSYAHAVMFESALAAALTLRGAEVNVLLCDNSITCCQLTKISNCSPEQLLKHKHTPRCNYCRWSGERYFGKFNIPIHWYGKLISKSDRKKAEQLSNEIDVKKIGKYKEDGIAIGEHALAGALRYFARADLINEPFGEEILRRFLKASLLSMFSINNLLKRNTYDAAVIHHGIYVPQGIIGEVCRKMGVHVITWNPSYRKQTFIFSHEDSYHHTMITEPVCEWENIILSEEVRELTMSYLKSRWYGTEDWIWFHEKPIEDFRIIAQEIGIDFNKPCIGMLTSVMWDAQLHYKSSAFKNMLEWVFTTIEYFSKRPDLNLIIRVHPAEVNGMISSRQKMVDEIKSKFPNLTQNIFIISPESSISTYAIMEKCNSVIIYNTKTGIELSSMGIPVIVAGEAWIRNKGFSFDANTYTEYLQILEKLPLKNKLDKQKKDRAIKYAYHFFFRRMIAIPFIISLKRNRFDLNLSNLKELLPGSFPGLDCICDGILYKKPFIIDKVNLK